MYKVCILLVLITCVYHNARFKKRETNILFLMASNVQERYQIILSANIRDYGRLWHDYDINTAM